MLPSDFDRIHDQHRRSMRRMQIASAAISFSVMFAIVAGGVWILTHPSDVGAFFGHVAAGFRGAQ